MTSALTEQRSSRVAWVFGAASVRAIRCQRSFLNLHLCCSGISLIACAITGAQWNAVSEDLKADFWTFLLPYLKGTRVFRGGCSFTNALMGLQPHQAQGKMSGGGLNFLSQCDAFLKFQIAEVRPRAVIILGEEAEKKVRRISCKISVVRVRHPSSFYAVKNDQKEAKLDEQAALIATIVGRGSAVVQVPPRYRYDG